MQGVRMGCKIQKGGWAGRKKKKSGGCVGERETDGFSLTSVRRAWVMTDSEGFIRGVR